MRILSPPQSGILGLAWAPSGKEVWFSGASIGIRTELKATDLSGHTRVVASGPGSLVIHDIASNGSVLLRHENARATTMALGPGQNQERDLTIRDWTGVSAISADGRQAVLEEQGTGSQPGYDVYMRPTDGSPPVHLGGGVGLDLSPDGKWVLARLAAQVPSPLVLIPLGPGEAKQITHDSIDHSDDARFLPDGNTIVFTGAEPGRKPRIYIQVIGFNTARPISPEGVRGATSTADGKFVFGFSDQVLLYSVDGQSAPREVPGIHPDERIAGVMSDGHTILVEQVVRNTALNIFRVELASGRRELFKKIGPSDLAGVFMFPDSWFTPDGKCYAYSYSRILSQLYIVDGLR
jgi:Tol biopolymer transport system component